jgi:phosphoribosyl-dephospho-CoA transferase
MFSRHELVWLSPTGWQHVRASSPAGEHALLNQWQREDWPAIVRRAEPGAGSDDICLGIAVAPEAGSGHKRKLAIRAHALDVRVRRSPLPLTDVIRAAPTDWRAPLAELDAALPGLRVYGSLALQAVTAQAYISPRSDIDLLFAPTSIAHLREGLNLLQRFAAILPLDGEIIFPSHEAVSWKEWIAAEPGLARVLVKANHAVRLEACAALLASFGR